ncbi:hypothetical protein AHAS_Ahas09G0026300 [Arachis hypogaea]
MLLMAPRLKKITALSTWMALLCEETLFLCSRLKASYHSRTHDDSDSSITGEAFSLKKSGRDGDDGTEEVTVLTLVEKSTLSMLQRASLVEKSRQKPPEKMRVLSDVRCYSKF